MTLPAFLARLVELAEVVEIRDSIAACRDPKDDKFLELFVNGYATLIISGDQDLLTLNPFRSIEIITPQEFVTRERTTTDNS